MTRPTRWATETRPGHSRRLIERFRRLAAEGADLSGEARFLDVLLPRRARVLDAGCGTGRVGAFLASYGHVVVGVDADEELVAAAREEHPDLDWRVGDLTDLAGVLGDRDGRDGGQAFDAAILAGNVMPYLAPDTEVEVLRQIAGQVRAGGAVVAGFAEELGYRVGDFDRHVAAAGLVVEHRFATWDLRPWTAEAGYAVTVLRRPV